MTRAMIVDLSKHQGVVTAQLMADAGFCGAYIRNTLGWGYEDPRYLYNQDQVLGAGMVFGAYHVLWPRNSEPEREAHHFLDHLVEVPDFVVLDVETDSWVPDVLEQAHAWLIEIEAELGKRPWVYTGSWYWDRLPGPVGWENDYHLIEAEYYKRPDSGKKWYYPNEAPQTGHPTSVAKGWDVETGWQWTSSGYPYGVESFSLDYNVLDMTEAEFIALVKGGELPNPLDELGTKLEECLDIVQTLRD